MKRLIAFAVLCAVVGITVSGCQTVTTDSPKLEVGKEYEIFLDSDRHNSRVGILESQSKEWLYVKGQRGGRNYHINLNHVTCISEILGN